MCLKKIPDILFKWFPLILVGFWISQALYSIYNFGLFSSFRMFGLDIFSDFFNVGTGTLHASTALVGYTLFIVSFLILRHIPIPHRTVIAFTIPVFGLLFYDLIHIIADFFIIGRGNPLIQAVLVSACFLILFLYNRSFNYMQLNILFIPILCLFTISFVVLLLSGFFQNLYLYGASAHTEIWLLTKLSAVWLWVGVIKLE